MTQAPLAKGPEVQSRKTTLDNTASAEMRRFKPPHLGHFSETIEMGKTIFRRSRDAVFAHGGKALAAYEIAASDFLEMLEKGHYKDATLTAFATSLSFLMGPVGSTLITELKEIARSEEEQTILDQLPRSKTQLAKYALDITQPQINRLIALSQYTVMESIERGDVALYIQADKTRLILLQEKIRMDAEWKADLEWLDTLPTPQSHPTPAAAPTHGLSTRQPLGALIELLPSNHQKVVIERIAVNLFRESPEFG